MNHSANVWGKSRSQRIQLAGFLSGLLLTLPGVLPALAPVQMVAFVPLLLALGDVERKRECLSLGLRMGLAYVAVQLVWLRLPAAVSLILTAYFLVWFVVLAYASWLLARHSGVWGCIAFGALLVVLDWIGFTALPMWGTAQSLVRCWSSYPYAIAFTCLTGITGVTFALAASQALAVNIILRQRQRLACVAALAAVLLGVGFGNSFVKVRTPVAVGPIKVGAVGWVLSRQNDLQNPEVFNALYVRPLEEAARRDVRLVVSPETAFSVYDDGDPNALDRFAVLSREHDVYLVVGYFDAKTGENRAAFIGPREGIMGRYVKTHLTPFEHYPAGKGEPMIIRIGATTVGALICQDDNYTDISCRYGVLSTGVIAIPTNDWGPVRRAHLQNTIHRAIESRFGIVRAASNGISAIISPHGEVLARMDHFKEGPGLIVAEVPVYRVCTIFSRFGHWFVAAGVIFLFVYVLLHCRPMLRRRDG